MSSLYLTGATLRLLPVRLPVVAALLPRVPGVAGALLVLRFLGVAGTEPFLLPRASAGFPPVLTAFFSASASFLMLLNWNWIPSGVLSPKYLAISGAHQVSLSNRQRC